MELLNAQENKPTKPLSYGQTVVAKATCTGLEYQMINLTLWEDDAKGSGHSPINQKNRATTKTVEVKRGIAKKSFKLMPSFDKMAKAFQTNGGEGKLHEYYVTASLRNLQSASNNIDVNALEEPAPPVKKKIPVQDPKKPKPNVPKPSTPTQPSVKKEITDVKIFKTSDTTLKVHVYYNGLQGKKIRFKLMEDDGGYLVDDELINQVFDLPKNSDCMYIDIDLKKVSKSKGDDMLEGSEQELFVDIEVLETASHHKTATLNVNNSGFKQDPVDDTNKVVKVAVEEKKKEDNEKCVCEEEYKGLIWGNKVSCEFRKKVVDICKDLWGESRKKEMADGLMAVMNVETSGSFKAHQIMGKSLKDVNSITKDDFWLTKSDGSKTSRAVGLIQFTQAALEQIGEFNRGTGFDKLHEIKLKFAKMGEVKQLDHVKKYFEDSKDKIKSPEDIYLHVFAPKGVGENDDFVLYKKGTEEYRQNKSVDEENNNDGKIQRNEILGRYKSSFSEGKGNKADSFTCKADLPKNVDHVKDIVTYKVYSSGKIVKNIPKEIKQGNEKKYKYQYIDKNEEVHELGIYEIIKTQQFGGKKGTYVNLVNLDKVQKTYNKGGYGFTFNVDSPRKYVNEKTLASFFGALLEVNYNDISCNGFSHADGSSKPSKSHINGNNGDFKFLRNDKKLMFGDGTSLDISKNPKLLDFERQNKWNDALYKFGWKSMLGWTYTLNGKTYKLNHIPKNTDNHHHHLHLQGYRPNFNEIKL